MGRKGEVQPGDLLVTTKDWKYLTEAYYIGQLSVGTCVMWLEDDVRERGTRMSWVLLPDGQRVKVHWRLSGLWEQEKMHNRPRRDT